MDGRVLSDEKVIEKIREYKEHEFKRDYGYHTIKNQLKNDLNVIINHKKVYRLMKELKLLRKRRKKALLSRTMRCKNREVTASNQLWESDIKYLPVAGERKTLYMISVIDVYDREIIAYRVVESCTAQEAKVTLLEALYNRGLKGKAKGLIVRTDNGSQYVSEKFISLCIGEGIIAERIPPSSPNYNAHIESYHRYFDESCMRGRLYMTSEELKGKVARYVKFYSEERPHSSLEGNTPKSVYESGGSILKNDMIVTL